MKRPNKPARRGRPLKFGSERTRGPLTIRLRDRVRDDLAQAARGSGRSLSEEIEYRLELALARRDYLVQEWGEDVFKIAEAAARCLWHIERTTGLRWIEPDAPLAHPLDDGTAVMLEHDLAVTAAELGPDGAAYLRLMRPLVDHWPDLCKEILGPVIHLPQELVGKLDRHVLDANPGGRNLERFRFGLLSHGSWGGF